MPLHHHTQHMNRHIGAIRPPLKLLFFIGTCLTARTHVLASIRMVPYGITTTMTTRKIRHSPAASRPLLLPELRMLRASKTHEQAGGVVFSTEGAGISTSSGCSGDSRKSNTREKLGPLLSPGLGVGTEAGTESAEDGGQGPQQHGTLLRQLRKPVKKRTTNDGMRHPASFAPGDTFAAAHLSTAASEDALSGLGAGGWQANDTDRASARGKEGSRLPCIFRPLTHHEVERGYLAAGQGEERDQEEPHGWSWSCRAGHREGCNRSTRQGSTRCSRFLDTKHAHTLPYPLMLHRDNRLRRWGGRRTENRQGETNHGLGAWLNVLPGANSPARRAASELPRASHPEAPLFMCSIMQTHCLRQRRPPRFSWHSDGRFLIRIVRAPHVLQFWRGGGGKLAPRLLGADGQHSYAAAAHEAGVLRHAGSS